MGPFQARVTFIAFVAVCAAIAINALYFQQGRHPAPWKPRGMESQNSQDPQNQNTSQSRAPETHSQRKIADRFKRSTDRQVKNVKRPSGPISQKTRQAIVRELKIKGYEPGSTESTSSIYTVAAIMAYQHDQRVRVTGVASEALLSQLIFGGAARVLADTGREARNTATRVTKVVQKVLADLGYAPGPIDGMGGASTSRAIRQFEKDRELPQTGRVSARLVRELERVSGVSLNKP